MILLTFLPTLTRLGLRLWLITTAFFYAPCLALFSGESHAAPSYAFVSNQLIALKEIQAGQKRQSLGNFNGCVY